MPSFCFLWRICPSVRSQARLRLRIRRNMAESVTSLTPVQKAFDLLCRADIQQSTTEQWLYLFHQLVDHDLVHAAQSPGDVRPGWHQYDAVDVSMARALRSLVLGRCLV
ncbi:MAG: hypothetical protein RI898_1252, partial [Actinomycetota bacterium]